MGAVRSDVRKTRVSMHLGQRGGKGEGLGSRSLAMWVFKVYPARRLAKSLDETEIPWVVKFGVGTCDKDPSLVGQ